MWVTRESISTVVVVTQGEHVMKLHGLTHTHRSACIHGEICIHSMDCTNASFLTQYCTVAMQDVLIGRGWRRGA